MAQAIITDQSVYLDGYDLTGRTNAIALEYGAEVQDNTTLGAASRTRLAGLKSVNAQVEGYVDIDATDAALFSSMGLADVILTMGAGGDDVGDPAYFFKAVESELEVGDAIGEIFPFSISAEGDGALVRGTMMLNSKDSALTTTTNGTGQQVGAASASQTVYAALHILEAGTGSITVTIESDSTNSFSGSETTQITFDAATGVGSQIKTASGAITDDWWRAVATISGGSPSFKAIVVVGII
jgi:hypothetical protein